ncbi:MAG: VCBS repeat-containing protein, partial [Cytophagales bacterium]|nr:VCBS repeat-containing protein [Cytophagales bacterium]
MKKTIHSLLFGMATGLGLAACQKPTMLEEIRSSESGLRFVNRITETEQMNIMNYAYFYNGGGVGCGDFNGDGLPDLVFTGNQVGNRIYINKGGLQFEDATQRLGLGQGVGWYTGVSLADVNGDGWLDIYLCKSGLVKEEFRRNELYINQNGTHFEEQASLWGLDDPGYSTQAAFLDYDR